MKTTQLGKLDSKAVCFTENSLAVEEDHEYLREMSSEEVARFVHEILGEKELHGLKGLDYLNMRVNVASTKCWDCGEYGAWQHDLREYDPDFGTGIYGGHNGEFIVYLCAECDKKRRKEVSK